MQAGRVRMAAVSAIFASGLHLHLTSGGVESFVGPIYKKNRGALEPCSSIESTKPPNGSVVSLRFECNIIMDEQKSEKQQHQEPQEDLLLKKSGVSITKSRTFGGSMSRLKVRRQTLGFSSVPGIKPIERTSTLGLEFKRPPVIYLNTYQLDPTVRFQVTKVSGVIEDLLDENFTSHKYNVQESPALALRLAGEVMRKVKRLNYDRYRIFSVVTIGQKRAQSHNNAVAFLWDHERDNFVEANHETATAFIQIIVFGVYLD
ncbi:hypothetical protein evm_000592 [Chilo suppressalis]|nr:hypothetical protein evm_000592 [Chilo suppressalis]